MSERYRIGRWEVDPFQRRLRRDDESSRLSPRAMDVLIHLAEHPAEVISGDALIQAHWPRAVTSPNALQKIITELRHALHDGHDGNTYIETVPKRGYRLIAEVACLESPHSMDATLVSVGE